MEIVTFDETTMKSPLSMTEKVELWYKYYPKFTSEIYLQLLWTAKKNRPWLEMNKGKDTYTDQKKIVIGLDSFECYDETEFLIWVLYLIDHEVGHIKHTPHKPWVNGIIRGYHAVLETISEQIEGKGKRAFRKEADYDKFLEFLKTDHNISLNSEAVKHFCHSIQNSLEDGREERLQSKNSYAFKMRKRYCRGIFWNKGVIPQNMIDNKDTAEMRFLIKVNQILSIATTLLYQKDFDKLDDELLYNEIEDSLKPLILKAYYSRNCSGCMDMAVEIEKLLAKDMFEALKKDATLEELLKQLIKEACEKENHSGLTSSEISDDEEDDESNNTASTGIFDDDNDSGNGGSSEDANGSNTLREINGKIKISDSKNNQNNEESSGCAFDHSTNRAGSRNESAGAMNVVDVEAIKQAIKDAMEDAKAQSAGLLEKTIAAENKPQPKEKEFSSEAVRPCKSVEEAYTHPVHFVDNKRIYKLRYKLPADLEGRAKKFADEISEILANQRKTLNGLNSGTLNSNSIYKLLVGDTDMFYRYDEPKKFDGVVYFLQDNSGSMGYGSGSKREYACEAVTVVEKGFSEIMPMKHVAFDAMGADFVSHETIKEFDEKQELSCAYNFLMQGRGGCGNKDGYSIRIATQELLDRNERQKLLVVLSDGAPSDYVGGFKAGREDVKNAVDNARNAGIIVVPIYFADNINNNHEIEDYKQMYGDSVIATTPDRIELELCKLLKTFCFN